MAEIERAWSVTDIYEAKFDELEFDGDWLRAIGKPERTGSWIIMGLTKSGKTTLSMMLAKYLTTFGRVYYNSIEEGKSKSIQEAYKRVGMIDAAGKMIMKKESYEKMITRLKRHKSPEFVFIDTVQFMEMKFREYKELKEMFPSKIFIYVSHMQGKQPDGITALKIMRDANVIVRVEGRRAFFVTRYEGEGYIDIDTEYAVKYWLDKGK